MIQMTRTTLALIAIFGVGGLVPAKAQAQGAPGPGNQDGFQLSGPAGIEVGAQVLTDVSGTNDGMTAKFEVGYNRFLSQRTMLMIGASTSWADEKYMQAYFGVTPVGAAASGLPVYTAGSGVENVELTAGLMYRINERWSALGMVNYQRLFDTAADSPIVQFEGSEDQAGIMFGVSRSF